MSEESSRSAKSSRIDDLIEVILHLSPAEVAELRDRLYQIFGLSLRVGNFHKKRAGKIPGPESDQYYWRVTLEKIGDPIQTIKTLRQLYPHLGVGKARAMISNLPVLLEDAAMRHEAELLRDRLIQTGAEVSIT